MIIFASVLARCTGASIDRATLHVDAFNDAMLRYDIKTPRQQAMFLANAGYESGGLRWSTEIWGPTPTQKLYERDFDALWPPKVRTDRNWKAYNLGNTKSGDGRAFCGHGWFQNTGRANHVAVRNRMRQKFPAMTVPDFELFPARLAEPQWAALAAADYVDMRDLSAWANANDFDGYCDIVNLGRHTDAQGDSNGWADRVRLYTAGCQALGIAP